MPRGQGVVRGAAGALGCRCGPAEVKGWLEGRSRAASPHFVSFDWAGWRGPSKRRAPVPAFSAGPGGGTGEHGGGGGAAAGGASARGQHNGLCSSGGAAPLRAPTRKWGSGYRGAREVRGGGGGAGRWPPGCVLPRSSVRGPASLPAVVGSPQALPHRRTAAPAETPWPAGGGSPRALPAFRGRSGSHVVQHRGSGERCVTRSVWDTYYNVRYFQLQWYCAVFLHPPAPGDTGLSIPLALSTRWKEPGKMKNNLAVSSSKWWF